MTLVSRMTPTVYRTAPRVARLLRPVWDIDDVAQSALIQVLGVERRHGDKPEQDQIRIARVAIKRHHSRLIQQNFPSPVMTNIDVIEDPAVGDSYVSERACLESLKSGRREIPYDWLVQFAQTIESPEERVYFRLLVNPPISTFNSGDIAWCLRRSKSWASRVEHRLREQLRSFVQRQPGRHCE